MLPQRIKVQAADFDISEEVRQLRAPYADVGAVAMFLGTVRDLNLGESVSNLYLEHYPGMTEKALEKVRQAAMQRWNLIDSLIIHRVGELKPQDQIVLTLALSRHRQDAIDACNFMMDYLKSHAPFWKKETTPDGERWVDARTSDEEALKRWGLEPQDLQD